MTRAFFLDLADRTQEHKGIHSLRSLIIVKSVMVEIVRFGQNQVRTSRSMISPFSVRLNVVIVSP